ncbi:MAG: hypothetical protein ACFFAS_04215 [Promethearchaeota archaeon]
MNFDEGIARIKEVLAEMGYNILGYNHTEAQLQSLLPWFYPKKKDGVLPPEVGEFLNQVKDMYPIVACHHKKATGQVNTDVFCGIKADGLSIEAIQNILKEAEATFHKIEKERFPPKTVGWSLKRTNYVSVTLALIYENGLADSDIKTVQSCWKKLGLNRPKPKDLFSTRPFIIDLVNKIAYPHKGIPLISNAPLPKKFATAVFGL